VRIALELRSQLLHQLAMLEVSHEQIRAQQDRSWTMRLLAALQHADECEQREIFRTLSELADPRSLGPLRALLANVSTDTARRAACAQALRDMPDSVNDAQISSWRRSGDAVLEEYALHWMHRGHTAELAAILTHPAHPYFRAAVDTLVYGFEAPLYQNWKVGALSHAGAEVRRVAASVLHWDEPLCAREPLVNCLRDAHAEVAAEAARTLSYYPAIRVIRALEGHAELAGARASLTSLLDDFQQALADAPPGPIRDHLLSWMKPIAPQLAAAAKPGGAALIAAAAGAHTAISAPPARSVAPEPPRTSAQLMAWLLIADDVWSEKLYAFRRAVDLTDAQAHAADLAGYFVAHADASVRAAGCQLLAELGQAHALRQLMHDPVFLVRKSAVYAISILAPEQFCAESLWLHLARLDTASTHAYETLVSYARHAVPAAAIPRLVLLVLEDEREVVRREAVHQLAKLADHAAAVTALEQLMPLLAEPPRVTWSVHLALLDAARQFRLRPPLDHLLEVDDLHMQVALARLLHG
jgi:HEAT repeat protein